jgi:D-alanyl-D-alanine carboxypeptidase
MRLLRPLSAALALLCLGLALSAGVASAKSTDAEVQAGLEGLVTSPGGPPGAIATLYRNGKLTTLSAGRSDIKKATKPRATDHMRIASVAKAFSGAVALNLVQAGKLSLDDTIGKVLPTLPSDWSAVTLRQMLHHTSGLPDYTKSKGFKKQAETDPTGFVSPEKIISWVAKDRLVFKPDSKYEYSNTDNIVFGPSKLTQTSLPTKIGLPSPYIHGYLPATETEGAQDFTNFLSPSGAWASGGIVSTPQNLNAFIRADLGLKYFDRAQQEQQMDWWVGGESSPPGPGKNSAGLALFRYQTKCGTVYGHTGSFPGYAQFAAATADGSRAITTTLNIPAPTGKLLAQLRRLQTTAVCDLLGK